MAGQLYSDTITTNALPDAMRPIFSAQLEFTSRPNLVTDQPEFVETWEEFTAKRGNTVTRTVYHQLAPSITPLGENQDVTTGGLQDHQVSLQIQEYGAAEGITEALDLLSYHGPISNVIKSLLGPQMGTSLDTLARNALWYGQAGQQTPMFKIFGGGAASDRVHVTSSQNLTADMVRATAYRLGVRRVPVLGDREPSYICLAHPSVIYDLRGDSNWRDANLYAGSTRIFTGEEGMMHGTRFLKSDRYRVANGGTLKYQKTLAAGTYSKNTNSVVVSPDTTGLTVGDEITLHATGDAVTAPNQASATVSWTAPNGKDGVEEQLIISAINTGTNTVTFTNKLQYDHSSGEFLTEAYDVYPLVFLGGLQVLAKGVAIYPEVRVALPTDKLRRMSYIGWYALLGYGISRSWAYEINEVTASVNVPPVYGF